MLMCHRALNIPPRATSQTKNFHNAFFAVGKTRHRMMKKLIQVTQESGGLAREMVSLCPSLMPCDPQLKGFTHDRRLCGQSSSLTDASWISHQPFFENQCLAASNHGVSHKSAGNTETTHSYWATKHICQKIILINKV